MAFTNGTDAPLLCLPPPGLKTPPQPALTHRKFSFPSLASSFEEAPAASSDAKKPQLRLVFLATDGFWDELSSREVVSLVAGHLNGLRTLAISKSVLSKQFPTCLSDEAAGVEGKDAVYKCNQDVTDGQWAFVDENIAQHLVPLAEPIRKNSAGCSVFLLLCRSGTG